jgi:holliday junction DNA helicase RuvA|tara:strand:+ start:804 stop:1442 length:639 start_codon:yes stop_codon:yes gene_type:complete
LIGRIAGILLEKKAPELLVDVQGVGYELLVSLTTFFALPNCGEKTTLYVHMVVREDAQQLYGFSEFSERELFRMLIKVNGVGPKMALTILSGMTTKDFSESVRANDTERLVKLPGVGKKTAERLIIEVRDRLPAFSEDINASENASSGGSFCGRLDAQEEAESVLIALGYKPQEASRMIGIAARSFDGEKDGDKDRVSEKLIRLALKSMVKS